MWARPVFVWQLAGTLCDGVGSRIGALLRRLGQPNKVCGASAGLHARVLVCNCVLSSTASSRPLSSPRLVISLSAQQFFAAGA